MSWTGFANNFPAIRSFPDQDGLSVHPILKTPVRQSIFLPMPTSFFALPTYWKPFGSGQKDRKSTRLNSSHVKISYAVFCLKKKTTTLDKWLNIKAER